MQKRIRLFCVFSAVLLLAGCTAPSDSGANPWHKEFAAAKLRLEEQKQDGQFQISVMEDGEITKEEFEEAQSKFVKCMADSGYTGIIADENGTQYDADVLTDPVFQEADRDCSAQYTSEIGGLYHNAKRNPNNEDPDKLMLACLKRSGLVPEEYTISEMKQVEEAFDEVMPVFEGKGHTPKDFYQPIREPDVTLPNGLQWNDSKLAACHINPLGVEGLPYADGS